SIPILIDSTGLPNDIKCNFTAINNHNGVVSNEIRLIVAMDKNTGFPIYYQYVPGNIVDVSTLENVIYNLIELGVNIDKLILDAGYYSESNISALFNLNIHFMTRMPQHYSIYNLLVKKYSPIIRKLENSVNYGHREVFVIKTQIEPFKTKIPLYAYVCLDLNKQHEDYLRYREKHDYSKLTEEQYYNDCLKHGIFILISTLDLANNQLLPCYYSRQSIEQFFDTIKNDIDLLPLRTHKPITFSGHLMISFISNIIYFLIDKQLKEKKLSFTKGLFSLSHHFARIYRNNIIPNVPTKNINDILKVLGINISKQVPIKN
ncbi:MAG: transposase, partial [Elusimicrobiota bacterium]|nr:transposase [Elusimicrobiota bacterium]